MAMSQSDIYNLAKSAGLTDDRAKVATAVAMAESSGDPNAHNTKPPDDSYGLWQINMLGSLGPARRKQLGLNADSDLFNPQTNAKAMAVISANGGNFNPWSTYTNGSYQKFMGSDVKDDPSWLDRLGGVVDPFGLSRGVIGGVNKIDDVVEFVARTAAWTSNPRNWVRIVYVAGGSLVVLVGLLAILEQTSAGKTVTKLATTAATKGRGSGSRVRKVT